MRSRMLAGFIVLLLGTASALPARAARTTELTVFAAASLTDALKTIGMAYEKSTGVHVAFNFGASSTLARQIEAGAPADVFFSADEAKMNGLAAHHHVRPETRRSLLSNTLVVVVPADAPRRLAGIAALAGPGFKTIAIADPLTVPAGIYAKQYLRAARVWSKVVDRLIPTDNVRATLSAVEAGNVDAGIVYKTDALTSSRVAIAFDVPQEKGPRISYPVAVTTVTTQPLAAGQFVAYLASRAALDVFQAYGFRLAAQR